METWEIWLTVVIITLASISGLCTGWWLKAIAVAKEMRRIEEAEAMVGIDRMKVDCVQCGSKMASTMEFCPTCGGRQKWE